MVQLKAGHAPAQRVGNMRVKQHKRNVSKERVRRTSESDEYEELSKSPKQQVVVSGAVTKGDVDFPPEAIKSYHDKVPTHIDSRSSVKSNVIQQPRKM